MDMKKFFKIIVFIFPLILSAQERWVLDSKSSFVTYDADHFLHAWSAKNNNIKGVILSRDDTKSFQKVAIAMYVRDFDSNNDSRDNNALEILEILKFPKIQFFSEDIQWEENQMKIKGVFNFHGIEVTKTINARVKVKDKKLHLDGNFELMLSDFEVPLPSFMMKKMEDKIELNYKLRFDNNER